MKKDKRKIDGIIKIGWPHSEIHRYKMPVCELIRTDQLILELAEQIKELKNNMQFTSQKWIASKN